MTLHQAHLNDDQIDDVLIGDAAADLATHLAGCANCRQRVTAAQEPMVSFRDVTLAWSERQSATMAPQSVGTNGSPWGHKLNWAIAAVVLAVVGFLLPFATREAPGGTSLGASTETKGQVQQPVVAASTRTYSRAPEQDVARAETQVQPVVRASNEELARDNRMLEAIDDELDASVRSPADTFDLSGSGNKDGGGHVQHAPAPVLD